MPISNVGRACLFVLVTSLTVWADQLVLPDEARLTGTVRSISDTGVVEIASELSPEPFRLKPDAVRKLTFEKSSDGIDVPGSIVELINGDTLPVKIGTFDGDVLNVATQDMGDLAIPKTSLKSIQLGIRKQRSIYSGPKSVEEWADDAEGSKNWRFVKGALSATGPAVAVKKLDLPSRFVFKFTLKWQGNPNFVVYFADPLTPKADQVDRYFFQFNSSGMEVRRESSKGQKIQPIILLTRSPDDFPTSQVNVEIRVDRKTSRLHLLLNGEPEAAGIDPGGNAPEGSGFVFISSSPSGNLQEIRAIEVLDFDDSKERHRSEERGDTATDSMISRDDDRWGGVLTNIGKSGERMIFTFKSDFQDAPLELSEGDVSTVFFAKKDSAGTLPKEALWVLKLRGEGSLQMNSCVFSDQGITASHPLLGPLMIRRGGLTELERFQPKIEDQPQE